MGAELSRDAFFGQKAATFRVIERFATRPRFERQLPVALVAGYGYVLADPTSRETCRSLQEAGWEVVILQLDIGGRTPHIKIPCIDHTDSWHPSLPGSLRGLSGPLTFWAFRRNARSLIKKLKPNVVVTTTLADLAALPPKSSVQDYSLCSAILDIPVEENAGRFDRQIIPKGWRRLQTADLVWASDELKAALAAKRGRLSRLPYVSHNCPPSNFLPEPAWPRDPWLRTELRRHRAPIDMGHGSVLLRAGAIGERCGLEETLEAMAHLPENYIFVMMGRPSQAYKTRLLAKVKAAGLTNRAFLWDRPNDDVWNRSLRGADIAHLIHGPFPSGPARRQHDANSSLSNYRLYYYMAAGLPIIAYDDPRMDAIYSEVDAFRVARTSHLATDLEIAWRELGNDATLRASLGKAAREAHKAKYNWEAQFAPILHEIMKAVS